MAELAAVALAERLAHLAQQGQPRLGDADVDDAAVVGRPVALDQAALLQLVEQAGDVRGARDEPAGQVQRADLVRVVAGQQPQGVVLLRRQVVAAEQFFFQGAQPVVGPPQAEEDLLLQRIKTMALRVCSWH